MNFVYLKFLGFCRKILKTSIILLFSLDPTALVDITALEDVEDQADSQSQHKILRVVDFNELKILAHNPEYDMPLWFVEESQVKSVQCYGSFKNSQLCSYLFISQSAIRVSGNIATQIPPNHLYCLKVFTLPEWRKQGLFRELLSFSVSQELAHQKAEKVFVYIYAENQVSIQAFRDFGFKLRGVSSIFRSKFPVNFVNTYLFRMNTASSNQLIS